jgi:hypothetical protein
MLAADDPDPVARAILIHGESSSARGCREKKGLPQRHRGHRDTVTRKHRERKGLEDVVIPAKAGIHRSTSALPEKWIPAFADGFRRDDTLLSFSVFSVPLW